MYIDQAEKFIRIISDFPGSSLESYVWYGNKLEAKLFPEACADEIDGMIIDYGVHFLFGIHNSSPCEIEINVVVSNGQPPVRSLFENRLFISDDPEKEFVASGIVNLMDGLKWNSFQLLLKPNEKLFISNTQWRPYQYLVDLFEKIAESIGFERYVYGYSYQGRELVAYRSQTGNTEINTRPKILITSGFHPKEPDTWGTEAIMEGLNTLKGEVLLQNLDVVIVPIANPDGFLLGHNGITATGINMLWDFRYDDPEMCPEAVALWNLVKEITPWVYIDFHCYTVHGNSKIAGPYFKPVSYYAGRAAKDYAKEITQLVGSIQNTYQVIEISPSASFTKLTRETNVITLAKYHLHVDLGKDKNKLLAWDVFERAARVLLKKKYTQDVILFAPYGNLRKTFIDNFKYWFFGQSHSIRKKVAILVKKRIGTNEV